MKLKRIISIALVILICVSFGACSSNSSSNEIIGKWKSEGGEPGNYPGKVEFFSDGTLNYDDWGGTYTIDNDRLNCIVGADSYSFTFEIDNGTLYLTADDGTYKYYSYNESENSDDTSNETTSEETNLSDSCDLVVSYTEYEDGTKIEVVGNQTPSLDKTETEIGIIKNNEWLLSPTDDMPFIDKSTGMLSYDEYNELSDEIETKNIQLDVVNKYGNVTCEYIGNNCIHFANYIYNFSNGLCYKANVKTQELILADTSPEITPIIVTKGTSYKYEFLNLSTMKSNTINGYFAKLCKNGYGKLEPASEGLFYCSATQSSKQIYGFFDKNGNLSIDLTKYDLKRVPSPFNNGQSAFRAANSSGDIFDVIIDKNGKIISETPVD